MAVSTIQTSSRRVTLEKEVKEGARRFKTRSLTVTGQMSVKLPGREEYQGVTSVSVSYNDTIGIDLRGLLRDSVNGGVEVKEGRVKVTADRENKTETDLYQERPMLLLDPEITIYRGKRKTVLNQVGGVPVIHIVSGLVTYLN
jgi:hypothetical protein